MSVDRLGSIAVVMAPEQYRAASARSFQDASKELIVPIGEGITEITIGFQPFGINIWGSVLAIAAYNQPAVCLVNCAHQDGRLIFGVERVGGVMYHMRVRGKPAETSMRMFRDVLAPQGANRMQTVVMRSDRELGLVRGTERAIHWIEKRGDGKWHFRNKEILPPSGYELIHSATLPGDGQLWTIEGRSGLTESALCEYHNGGFICESSTPPWMYGIAFRQRDGAMLTITDRRFTDGEHGIYVDGVLKVPGIVGTGIALLDDGRKGAIVTRYGESHPAAFYGIPGALLYVPPHLLE